MRPIFKCGNYGLVSAVVKLEPKVDSVRPQFALFDGLRALAATLVFVDHSWFRWHPSSCGFAVCASSPGFFTAVWTAFVSGFGPLGVSVFYVISAFLLYRPFVASRIAGASVGTASYGLRRVARIFPAYWLALAVVLLFGYGVREYGLGDLARMLTLTQAYTFKGLLYNPIPPTWTICVELSFYLFLPVWALLLGRLVRRARRPVMAEMVCLLGLGASAFVWRFVVVRNPPGPNEFQHLLGFVPLSDKLLLASFDLFAAGMALAVLSAHGKFSSWPRLFLPVWAWGSAFVGFVALSVLMASDGPLGSHWWIQEVIGGGLRVPLAVLIVLPGVLHARSPDADAVVRILGSRWLGGLGLISYGVYLWHAPVLAWVHGWTGQLVGVAVYIWVLLAGASFALSLSVAAVSWRFLERPLIDLVHGRTASREADRPAEPSVPVG